MNQKKAVGINPSSQIHYTDHLAVVCILMGIPLLFIDEQDYQMGLKYYPGLEAVWTEYQDLTPEYLIANYDVLFMSDLWDRHTFHQKYAPLEKKYNKRLRHVHCPHGFSDKGFYLKKCAHEDIVLLYGQNMLDLLKYHHVFDDLYSYVITGNYRYTFFKKNQTFYDELMQKEILNRFDKKRPIVLYAPTWLDLEESTTFFEATSSMLDHLPDDFNVIVKLHPRLELDDIAQFYSILGKYDKKKNICFLKDFPLVFPLLAHTDIYIGDTSSIGYDFLAFDKPMFFLNKSHRNSKTDRGAYLFRCGIEILPKDYGNIFNIINTHLPADREQFSEIRKETYRYTFGEERPFEDIRSEIASAYSTDQKYGSEVIE